MDVPAEVVFFHFVCVGHDTFAITYSESNRQIRMSFLHSKVQRCLAILDNISDRKWHQEETFIPRKEMHVHVTTRAANHPVRECHNLFHLHGVRLEHKAGQPQVIWPLWFNFSKQSAVIGVLHQRFPTHQIWKIPDCNFGAVLYSFSADLSNVLRMHFIFCNFLLNLNSICDYMENLPHIWKCISDWVVQRNVQIQTRKSWEE